MVTDCMHDAGGVCCLCDADIGPPCSGRRREPGGGDHGSGNIISERTEPPLPVGRYSTSRKQVA